MNNIWIQLAVYALILVGFILMGFILFSEFVKKNGSPLDVLWGPCYYDYKPLEDDILLIEVNQFPGDEYMIEFQVQHVTRARRRGPQFARRLKDLGYIAEWSIPDGYDPIITSRGHAYGSSVPIPDPVDWRKDADDAFKEWVLKERRLPTDSPIFDSMQGRLLEILKEDTPSLKKFAVEFDETLIEDDAMMTAPLDNEVLKAQYTPGELAQQAINRDADPRTFFEQVADVQEIVDEANKKKES